MKVEAVSITIHEASEILREALRAKGIDPTVLMIESYGQVRVQISYDGKTDAQGRLLHKFETARELLHWTYVD